VLWNRHSDLEGTHARFGASKNSWVDWSDDKIDAVMDYEDAAAKGTRLHYLAALAINDRVYMSEDPKHHKEPHQATVARYANECIDLGMRAEVVLRYSDSFYGTADAIAYEPGLLQISDLKTGVNKASFKQLYIYAAWFFLEYGIPPLPVKVILRLYQNGDVLMVEADTEYILFLMSRIQYIEKRRQARLEAF
jgi:hypothetical protein